MARPRTCHSTSAVRLCGSAALRLTSRKSWPRFALHPLAAFLWTHQCCNHRHRFLAVAQEDPRRRSPRIRTCLCTIGPPYFFHLDEISSATHMNLAVYPLRTLATRLLRPTSFSFSKSMSFRVVSANYTYTSSESNASTLSMERERQPVSKKP